MKWLFVLWIVLFVAPLAPAQDIKLPKTVSGEVGAFIPVEAVTEGDEVQWMTPDKGLNLFPASFLSNKKATVVTGKEGTYRLYAWTALKGNPTKAAMTTITIGEPNPFPPDDPPPDDPPPNDAFLGALKAAFKSDVGLGLEKTSAALFLAGLFKSLAPQVTQLPGKFPTAASIMSAIKEAEAAPVVGIDVWEYDSKGNRTKLISSAIPNTRKAIGAELNPKLPTNPAAPLTAAERTLISTQFLRIAKALGSLGR